MNGTATLLTGFFTTTLDVEVTVPERQSDARLVFVLRDGKRPS